MYESCQLLSKTAKTNRLKLKLLNFLIMWKVSGFILSFSFSFSFSISLSLSFVYLLILFRHDRENSAYISKYSLRTERVEATITVGGFTARKNHYEWGGYSGMDLAVDEQGLWVLWGSTGNSKRLFASKIDVYKNVIPDTWALNTGRHILSPYQRGLIIGWG